MSSLNVFLASGAGAILAHVGPGPTGWAELARAWSPDPLVLVLLAASAWVYHRGSARLRAQVGRGRGLRGWERACFWAGWWTLGLALVSPLHRWGQVLFSAHMTQHELLMVLAAPLLVLGRPLVAAMLALPRGDARQVAAMVRGAAWRRFWRTLSHPLMAWALHAVALWAWHVPGWYEATLRNELLHHLQHACFFGTALLFWWALIHAGPGRLGYGVAALYAFTTMVHSGILGALLTFADTLLYPSYADTAPAWSLTPLEDQQLGGLIMWMPAGLVYLVAGLALVAGWMRVADRRAERPLHPRAPAQVGMSLILILLLVGCGDRRSEEAAGLAGGDPRRGPAVIKAAGCATCHTIPGIAGANGLVGPSLRGLAQRNYIGGVLANEPENLVRWLLDPRAHSPRTVMPNTGLTEEQARDVAAYLYTLR